MVRFQVCMMENKILSYYIITKASNWLSLPRCRYLVVALTPSLPSIPPKKCQKATPLLESTLNHLLLLIYILIGIDIVAINSRIEFVFIIGIEDLIRVITSICSISTLIFRLISSGIFYLCITVSFQF
jgi:hypothetical protein